MFGAKQDQDLFDWLSPSHWEVVGQLSEHIHRYMEGTLKWFYSTPELCSWLAGDAPNTLWITGLPGIGKSVIAAHLIKSLYTIISGASSEVIPEEMSLVPNPRQGRANTYLAYFFCKNGEHKLMHAPNIIQTLSYQLSKQSVTFRQELRNMRTVEQFAVDPNVNIRLLYNRLLEQPLSAMAKEKADRLDVICIVDGLDEADFTVKDERSGMSEIAILLQLLSKSPGIRLLVVSRLIHELFETMRKLPSAMKEINNVDNAADLERYVGWRISMSEKLEAGFRHLSIDPSTHLCSSARGNFLWLDVVLRYLEDSPSLKEFAHGLYEVPEQFFELYRQILQRIERTVPSRTKTFIKKIIQMTITAERELEVVELQGLVELITNDTFFDFPQLLKTVCGTFLRLVDDPIDPQKRYVRVAHETFREFITSDASHKEEFHVSLPEANGEFVDLLLGYLCQHNFGSQLTGGRNVRGSKDIADEIHGRFPLLKYASIHWSFHLVHSSVEPVWAEKSRLSLIRFLTIGPLLLWIEALATFGISALSTIRENCVSVAGRILVQAEFKTLIETWARDLARIGKEYGAVLTLHPNTVYSILFDLFPSPSLFYNRYKKGVVLVSGGVSHPLHPAILGVNNLYDHDYDSSAFLHGQEKFLALASIRHIRVVRQAFGDTVNIISAPGSCEGNRWAVLAMGFSNPAKRQKTMFAVVHVPLTADCNVPYSPEISIWDLDTLTLIAHSSLDTGDYNNITLVDWLEFTEDNTSVRCGSWKYNIQKDKITDEMMYDRSAVFGTAGAIIMSRNGRFVLKLNSDQSRTLLDCTQDKCITFNKPPYYDYADDDPSILPVADLGYQRWMIAPFLWWQFWREVTMSYQFSPDSQLFARLTDDHCVVLHHLESFVERKIDHPNESLNYILMINLTFDSESRRVAWTFNFNLCETRIHIYDIETAELTGFHLGRYGWRERVDFCSNSNNVLTYRVGVTTWDVNLGLKHDKESQQEARSGDWVFASFTGDYCIRLQYSQESIFALYSEDSAPNLMTLQTFDRKAKKSTRISFNSQMLPTTNKWGMPWISDGAAFATENAIFDVTDVDDMKLIQHITINPPRTVIATTFHMAGSFMACVQQRNNASSFVLQLYSTHENQLLHTKSFGDETLWTQLTPPTVSYALVVFDPSVPPKYLFVFVALPNEFGLDPKTGPIDIYCPSNTRDSTLQVWKFDIPQFEQQLAFKISPSGAVLNEYTGFSGVIATGLGRIICIEESKHSVSCALWLIDVTNGAWSLQTFPSCWQLVYVHSREMVVALSGEGWVLSKSVRDMKIDVGNRSDGPTSDNSVDVEKVWVGWKKLFYLPPSYLPCSESSIAVHEKGELTYIGEYGKRLVQISFDW